MTDVAGDWQEAVQRFGSLLGRLREEAGLTTRELARTIGVAPATVSKTENGRHAKPQDFYIVKTWVSACANRIDGRTGSFSIPIELDWWRKKHGQLERLYENLRLRPLGPESIAPTAAVRLGHGQDPQSITFEALHQKVVDHLADRSPHVRMAALRTLGDMGDEYVEKRQRIVNELCDYLRIPPDASDAGEGQVRRTAQMVLAAKLRPRRGDSMNPTFWPDMDIDLKQAYLRDVNFNGCEFRRADFDEAQFEGEAYFNAARFTGEARFVGAVFLGHDAWFQDAHFEAMSWFRWVAFHGYAYFQNSYFGFNAEFSRSQFSENAYFDNMTVRNHAWFTHAIFHGSVTFQNAQADSATFWLDSFRAGVDFRGVQFASPPSVGNCEAVGQAERHWPSNWVELTSGNAGGVVDSWPEGWAAVVEKAQAAEIRHRWASRS